jgi:hypothetical protein
VLEKATLVPGEAVPREAMLWDQSAVVERLVAKSTLTVSIVSGKVVIVNE